MLTEQQHTIRRTGIGSSEIGTIVGVSPYSPIEVWRSKMEPGYRKAENPDMKRGRILENAVADWYEEETGAVLTSPGTLRHKSNPLVIATPDRFAELNGRKKVLEIKTAFHGGDWGESGTDQVPMGYITQVAWELAAADMNEADLAVLIGGHDFRVYPLKRDLELEGSLIERAEQWWRDYVVTGTPPPPDASDEYAQWLTSRYPKNVAPLLQATDEIESLLQEFREADLAAKGAEKRYAEVKNAVRAIIGDAEGIQSTLGKVTWRSNKDSQKTDWQEVAMELGADFSLIEHHTTTKPGPRVLRVPWKDV